MDAPDTPVKVEWELVDYTPPGIFVSGSDVIEFRDCKFTTTPNSIFGKLRPLIEVLGWPKLSKP